MRVPRLTLLASLLVIASCGSLVNGPSTASVTPSPCGDYPHPELDPAVGAEVNHLKTSATVLEVLSGCTVRVRIAGGANALVPFNGKVITLRAFERTTFASASQGDLTAIGRFGLKSGDEFTLSFDSRAFPDGSYPLNYMNR